jgi:hypothetical protein
MDCCDAAADALHHFPVPNHQNDPGQALAFRINVDGIRPKDNMAICLFKRDPLDAKSPGRRRDRSHAVVFRCKLDPVATVLLGPIESVVSGGDEYIR